MSTTQLFESPEGWYTLEFPRTWDYEIIENIPAFFDPYFGDGGVLQVFAAKTAESTEIPEEIIKTSPFLKGENLTEKMELFLGQQGADYDPSALKEISQNDSTRIIALEYSLESRFYMAAMYQKGATFLLALFNHPSSPDDEHAIAVSEILKSITLY